MAEILEFRPRGSQEEPEADDGPDGLTEHEMKLATVAADEILAAVQTGLKGAMAGAEAEYGLPETAYQVLLGKVCVGLQAMAYEAATEGGF